MTAAMALATALWTWRLTHHGLWIDEAISLGAIEQLGDTLRGTAGTMGLYYVLLHGWTSLVGDSIVALRGLSLVFALAAVVPFRTVARDVVGRREAIVALIVLGASPGLTRYAQEARSYALVLLLTVILWTCTAKAIEAHHGENPATAGRWWSVITAVSVGGVLAHGLFPLQVAAVAVTVLVLPTRRALIHRLAPSLIAVLATLGLLSTIGAGDVADWVPTLRWSQTGDLFRELLAPAPGAASALALLACVGAATLIRRPAEDPVRRSLNLIPVIWGVAPPTMLVAISVIRPYLISRYVIASMPGLVLLVAVGAVTMSQQIPRLVRRLAVPRSAFLAPSTSSSLSVAVLVIALMVAPALVVGQVSLHDRSAYDWRSAVDIVAERARVDDGLLFSYPSMRMPFEAAWRDRPTPTDPTVIWTARPLGTVRRFEALSTVGQIGSDLAEVDRLWLVHQTTYGSGEVPLETMLAFEPVREHFQVLEHHRFDGGVQVLLLGR